jgi:uncharacterized membrane protein
METLVSAVRLAHIAAGVIALVVAPVAMVTAKGGPTHRRWGKVYFWMMAAVAVTALALGLHRPAPFLTLVAVFSFYGAFSGYRALYRKRPLEGQGAGRVDRAAAAIMVAASAALLVLGALRPGPQWERLAVVAMVFGVLGVALGGRDLWRFARPPADRQRWWFDHMAGMLGSYIAAVTAFSVVNLDALPVTVRWLWPTALGVPLIAAWIAYYKRRFRARAGTPARRAA